MIKLSQIKIDKIIENHKLWLNDKHNGKQGNFTNVDLRGRILKSNDLRKLKFVNANLHGLNLNNKDLSGSILSGADFSASSLKSTNLSNTNLYHVNFYDANLEQANLSYSFIHNTDFRNAKLLKANLEYVFANEDTIGFYMACPEEGVFIGYKKANDKIVVLEITSDARRSSATSPRCRCSKAKVLRIEEMDGSISKVKSISSDYNKDFIYEVGKTVEVPDFDENRWNECSTGIHFFMNKNLAKDF